MPKELSFDEACDLLRTWTKTLSAKVENTLPHVKSALNAEGAPPLNAPSHASMAEMELRPLKKALDEVVGAVAEVERAIWATRR